MVSSTVRRTRGKPTMYNGYLYPSITEAHCRMMLDDKVRRAEYVWIKNQVPLPCLIDPWHARDYAMDFVAQRPSNLPESGAGLVGS